MAEQPRDNETPAWAGRMTGAAFRTFIGEVQAYFLSTGVGVSLDPSAGILRPKEGGDITSIGLGNLAKVCEQAKQSDWPALVRTHFDAVFGKSGDANPVTMRVGALGEHAAQLRSRLYPADIGRYTKELVSRPGPEETLEVLVLDLPGSVRTVARDETTSWALDDDDLFEIGRRNLLEYAPVTREDVSLPLGAVLHMFSGEGFYTASHIFHIAHHLPDTKGHGVLVAAPRRDVLLAHVIEGPTISEALSSLIQAAHKICEDGPGGISPKLFWAHNGKFVDLPYRLADNELQFSPPDDFLMLLQQFEDLAGLS